VRKHRDMKPNMVQTKPVSCSNDDDCSTIECCTLWHKRTVLAILLLTADQFRAQLGQTKFEWPYS